MTSKERREAASALRGCPNEMFIPQSRVDFEAMTCQQAAYRFRNMRRRVRSAADVDIAYDATSVLADLIDPTCGMEAPDTGEQADYERSERIMHCPKCGAEFGYALYSEDRGASMDDKPRFRPNCGDRAVSVDEQRK